MVKPKIALPMKQRLRLWFVVQSRTSMDGPEDAIKTGGDNIPSSPPGRGFLMDPRGGGSFGRLEKNVPGGPPPPGGGTGGSAVWQRPNTWKEKPTPADLEFFSQKFEAKSSANHQSTTFLAILSPFSKTFGTLRQ